MTSPHRPGSRRTPRVQPPFSALAILAILMALASPARSANRVVIVVLDGLRATEGFDDPDYRYIPHMGHELVPQGASARACDNNGQTYTIAGHSTIAAGRYQVLPDDGSVRPYYPLLWEYYRASTGFPERRTVVATSKTKIKCMSYSTSAGYGAPDSARILGPTWDDVDTVLWFLNDMTVNQPVVSFLNLGVIDGEAHSGDWARYTRAIQRADSAVALLWSRIQADPIYGGHTTMIITGDHGRHSDGWGDWWEHGDGCPGCRRIPLLALGPEFTPGLVSWTPCQQIDILKTVASTIGLAVPEAQGRVLSELFRTSSVMADDCEAGRELRIDLRGAQASFLAGSDGPLELYDVGGRLVTSKVIKKGEPWMWQSPRSGILFYHFRGSGPARTGRLVFTR
jgi:hypothetical protein